METLATKKRQTKTGCTYFDGEGAWQEEFDKLWKELVPASGRAETLHGELIRAAGRLTHEYYNNGNFNACEVNYETEEVICDTCHGTGTVEGVDDDGNPVEIDCPDCGGCGCWDEDVEGDCTINPYYERFLDLIEKCVPDIEPKVDAVRGIILDNLYSSPCLFSESRKEAYSRLVDEVVWYVLNSEDGKIPDEFDKED